MARLKTNQPLVIWCWYPWITHPEIVALADAGHCLVGIQSDGAGLTPITGTNGATPDLILHPAAHVWNEAFFGDAASGRPSMLPVAVTVARAAKRRKT